MAKKPSIPQEFEQLDKLSDDISKFKARQTKAGTLLYVVENYNLAKTVGDMLNIYYDDSDIPFNISKNEFDSIVESSEFQTLLAEKYNASRKIEDIQQVMYTMRLLFSELKEARTPSFTEGLYGDGKEKRGIMDSFLAALGLRD